MLITKEWLREQKSCYVSNYIRLLMKDKESITVPELLEFPISTACQVWILIRLLNEDQAVEFMQSCENRVTEYSAKDSQNNYVIFAANGVALSLTAVSLGYSDIYRAASAAAFYATEAAGSGSETESQRQLDWLKGALNVNHT